ncbi:MAG: tetratricopeptide repeat protein [bacterium]
MHTEKLSVLKTKRLNENHHQKTVALLLLFIISGISLSCSTYRNFTTYFNVVYLAQQHLDLYEESLAAEKTPVSGAAAVITTHRWLDEEYVALEHYKFRTGSTLPIANLNKGNGGTSSRSISSQHLDSAIILGSKVLADKKETKYVEDALFIVGKSQYYKNDFSGAKRKFNELLFRYPDTKYGTEVSMLMARSMMASNDYDTAAVAISRVLKNAERDGHTATISEAHTAYAELILVSSPDSLAEAAEQYKLAETDLSAESAARLSFNSGALYFLAGRWKDAEAAFQETIAKTPDQSLQGEAYVALGETYRRQKRYAEAKQTFEAVLKKSRYSASHPAANYEYALTTDIEARDAVKNSLKSMPYKLDHYPDVRRVYNAVDTTYRTISQAIMARSRFRQAEIFREMGEYDSAAHLANIIAGTKDFSSNEMNDFVNERLRAITRYADWKLQLLRIDTAEHIFHKLRRPGSTMVETITKELRIEAEQKVLGAKWSPEHSNPLSADESKLVEQYIDRIRKEKSAGAVSAFSINFADTTKYIDSIHMVAMHGHFEIARACENFTEYPTAISEYQSALNINFIKPDTTVHGFRAQILYSWLSLDNQLKNAQQRDSILPVLTRDYGETIYAQQAGKEFSGLADKDSPGEIAFRSAYSSMKSFGIENMKASFMRIVTDHSHEDVAAKSLYTIGLAYEDMKRYDSTVVYYRRVLKEYPYSRYAEYLKPKMQFAMSQQPRQIISQPQQNAGTNPPSPSKVNVFQDSVKQTLPQQKPVALPPKNEPPIKKK